MGLEQWNGLWNLNELYKAHPHQVSTPKNSGGDASAPLQFNIKIFMLFQY